MITESGQQITSGGSISGLGLLNKSTLARVPPAGCGYGYRVVGVGHGIHGGGLVSATSIVDGYADIDNDDTAFALVHTNTLQL